MTALDAGLTALIEPTVEALGYECVGVVRVGGGDATVVRVYIDAQDGVTVDDCERVSRQVGAVLDVEDPIAGGYCLEVSSPGLDRPLYRERDFRRFAGSRARLRTRVAIDGRRRFNGRLGEVRGGAVVVAVDDREFSVALDLIEEARLVAEV